MERRLNVGLIRRAFARLNNERLSVRIMGLSVQLLRNCLRDHYNNEMDAPHREVVKKILTRLFKRGLLILTNSESTIINFGKRFAFAPVAP